MSRNTVDGCLLCSPDPCECFGKKKPKKIVPKSKPDNSPTTHKIVGNDQNIDREKLRAQMRQAASVAPPVAPVPPKHVRQVAYVQQKSEEDLFLHGALRALKNILHEDELSQWGIIVNSEPPREEKSRLWKARKAWLLLHQ